MAQGRTRLVRASLALLTLSAGFLWLPDRDAPAAIQPAAPTTTVQPFDPARYLADCQQIADDYRKLQELEQLLDKP